MEIEKKFLLYEKGKILSNKNLIKNTRLLKLKTLIFGKKIIQSYISVAKLSKVIEITKIKPNFKPDEIRIRQYGAKYFLTFKSRQKQFQRQEFEVETTRDTYNKLLQLRKNYLIKNRYIKTINNFKVEFDYYKKFDLLICEIEVNSEKELNKIPQFGKLISGVKKYKNSYLAKHFE